MTMTADPAEQAVTAIPEGFHTITPSLTVNDGIAAIEFYQRAFNAQVLDRATTPDGLKILHSTLQIGRSKLMLNDEFAEMGCKGPLGIGGSPVTLHLYVEDADAFFEQAVAAGATVTMPIEDAFWGDRYGSVTDPYGHQWSIASRRRNVSDEELKRVVDEWQGCGPEGALTV
jgi:PhnB protein